MIIDSKEADGQRLVSDHQLAKLAFRAQFTDAHRESLGASNFGYAQMNMETDVLLRRMQDRLKPRLAVRFIPKPLFTGMLGPLTRSYVCLADYEELQGLTVRDAVGRIYGGRWHNRHQQETFHYRGYHFELAGDSWHRLEPEDSDQYFVVTFRLDDDQEVDFFPGTWKALAFIATDPKRLGVNSHLGHHLLGLHRGEVPFDTHLKQQLDFYEHQNPFEDESYNNVQQGYYQYLTKDSGWSNQLFAAFGIENRCWHGRGYVGLNGEMLCRVFLGRNLPLSHPAIHSCELLSLDDELPIHVFPSADPYETLLPESLKAEEETGGILQVKAGLAYYDHLKQQALAVEEDLGHVRYQFYAEATRPFKVGHFVDEDGAVRYVVAFCRGPGMEEDIWRFHGAHRERDAIKLGIVMRNLYHSSAQDALEGTLPYDLQSASERASEINRKFGSEAAPGQS